MPGWQTREDEPVQYTMSHRYFSTSEIVNGERRIEIFAVPPALRGVATPARCDEIRATQPVAARFCGQAATEVICRIYLGDFVDMVQADRAMDALLAEMQP